MRKPRSVLRLQASVQGTPIQLQHAAAAQRQRTAHLLAVGAGLRGFRERVRAPQVSAAIVTNRISPTSRLG